MTAGIRHIVAGTDFSAASTIAVRAAGRLASKLLAKLTVVHVYDPVPIGPAAMGPASLWPLIDLSESMSQQAAERLAALAQGPLAGARYETVALRHASASTALCDYAGQIGADLIMVGTHGLSGVKRQLVGSVAEQVIRHAPCHVMTTRTTAEPPAFPTHMVVCTDFSAGSEAALALAARLHKTLGVKVTLLHAQDEVLWSLATGSVTQRTADELKSRLHATLDGIAQHRFAGEADTSFVLDQDVAHGLVRRALALNADLLVVATHGRTGLSRLLIGSIAERVTRRAHCAVLMARSRDASKASEADA